MRSITVTVVAFLFVSFLLVQAPVASELKLDVKEATLSNGMTILVYENHDAPVFSTVIRARVGSVDEKQGQTGLSHCLEHMIFKGTQRFGTTDFRAEKPILDKIDSVGVLLKREWAKINNPLFAPDSTLYKKYRNDIAELQKEESKYIVSEDLWRIYTKNGGTGLNASTSQEGTQYYVSLPSNRLELWAILESDRIGGAIFREFYSERDVLYEERRQRVDNSPNGRMREAMSANAFLASGYGHSVVGWASDIQTWDRPLLEDYFKTYYAPNNLIAAIAGDVKAEDVFAMCEKYFGKIPRGPEAPIVATREPRQEGERRVTVEYDANPSIQIGWHCPAIGHPDNAALDVLTSILSSGRTSRFNKSIVESQKIAVSAYIWSSQSRLEDLIAAGGTPLAPHTCEEVELAIYAEIEKLRTEPVSETELEKIKNQSNASFLRRLTSNSGMAFQLADAQAVANDWRYILKWEEEVKSVTAADVMRIANLYFTPQNRTVVTLVKKSSGEHASGAGPLRKGN